MLFSITCFTHALSESAVTPDSCAERLETHSNTTIAAKIFDRFIRFEYILFLLKFQGAKVGVKCNTLLVRFGQ
jgi:hypothetical protein